MKAKFFLVILTAILATLITLVSVSALAANTATTVNNIDASGQTLGVFAGENLGIRVSFTANEDAKDVRVKTWIAGYRSEVSDSTDRFDIINGSRYNKLLSISLPSDIDPSEDYTLVVRVETKAASDEVQYNLKVQRESYLLEVLSVEVPQTISAGSNMAIDVVAKNRGMRKLDDMYIKVSIPKLSVETKAYAGDLLDLDTDDDKDDAIEKRIYLKIPSDAKAGTYTLEVEAYNKDANAKSTKTIEIGESEEKSSVAVPVADKIIPLSGEAEYELLIVNSGSKIRTYTISPEASTALTIVVTEPVVAVSADSSETIKVKVRANERGTHTFALNVESDGELVKRATFSASVSGRALGSTVVWTVVLAIIFVVLLIVLIVLLTRRPAAKTEEFGESYY